MPQSVKDVDYYPYTAADNHKIELGRLLFFDKILSGNKNISCATCHHPLTGSSDDLSLSVGEGGIGLALQRDLGTGDNAISQRVPRNSPHLFNLGASEFVTIFHDGRVQKIGGKITSPAGSQMPSGLDNPLAVQAMLPVTSSHEMAGEPGENPVADAAHENRLAGPNGVWELLAKRLRANSNYVQRFQMAFPRQIRYSSDITFVHAANAIAAFETVAFRSDNSPFDQYLRGNQYAVTGEAKAGMDLFYGKAKCAYCHSGKFQTDHQFHSIALPQIGPGKGDGYRGFDDYGRESVSKSRKDRYKFRTPTLRNVSETGPYGHDGAYSSLEAIVRHHLNPVAALHSYQPEKNVTMPRRADLDVTDFLIHNHASSRIDIANSNSVEPPNLTEYEIKQIVAFLHKLTDQNVHNLPSMIPNSVPSGLPVSDFVSVPSQ